MPKIPRKLTRATQAQINKLVEFMAADPLFANGEFKGPMGPKSFEEGWKNLKKVLDNYGPDKSVEQWKLTWRDLKKKARADNATTSKATNTTGNNTEVPKIPENSLKILGTIGFECSTGCGAEESPIGMVSMHPVELPSSVPSTLQSSFTSNLTLPSSSSLPKPDTQSHLSTYIDPSFSLLHHDYIENPLTQPEFHTENVPPNTTTTTTPTSSSARCSNVPPNTTTTTTPASSSARRSKASTSVVPHDFIVLQKEANDLQRSTNFFLEDISNTLQERNLLLIEQNKILREQNNIMKIQRFGKEFTTNRRASNEK